MLCHFSVRHLTNAVALDDHQRRIIYQDESRIVFPAPRLVDRMHSFLESNALEDAIDESM